MLYSGREEVMVSEMHDPLEELEAAKNCSFWSTSTRKQPEKRPNYKGLLEVGQGEGHDTRKIELIWWPGLFSTTNHG